MQELKILIVEDEDFVRETLIDYFEMKGYENILSVAEGKEALAIIEQEKPGLVLLDIQLADEMDGMQVLKKAKELSSDSKIVMMSAYYNEYAEDAKKDGAYGFIKKPIVPDKIQDLLKKIQEV